MCHVLLFLPKKIVFETGEISYLYDATGVKLKKTVHDENTSETTNTHYLDGFQYTDDELDFFPHAEGYVKVLDNSVFRYVYTYTDHLGNIRVKYTRDPDVGHTEILEENHYYPFGLTHSGYNGGHLIFWQAPGTGIQLVPVTSLAEDKYKYKFNGMEWQDELDLNHYDFGARNYDPALGRWMNIDPLAEQMRRHSPYNYAFNNPVYFIDPDGMVPIPGAGGSGLLVSDTKYLGISDTSTGGFGGFDVRTYDGDGKTLDFMTVGEGQGVDISADGSITANNYQTKSDVFNSQLKAAFGDKVNSAAPATDETVNEVIDGVPLLKQNDASNAKIHISKDYVSTDKDHKGANALTYEHNNKQYITLFGKSFSSYLFLAQTLFHEFVHVNDYRSGWVNNTFNNFCGQNYSLTEASTITSYLMEIRAYRMGQEVTGLQYKYSHDYNKAVRALTNRGIDF